MKLSEVQQFADLLSAYKNREINNETFENAIIEEGAILSNMYQELEMDSHSVDCLNDINYDKDNVQLHSHSFYEILYCQSGNIQYLLGTNRYQVKKGDIIFIPPGVSHRPLYLDKLVEPYARYVLWINPDFIKSTASDWNFHLLNEPVLFRTGGSNWEHLKKYFEQAYQEYQIKQEGYEACIRSLTITLLIYITRALSHSKHIEPLVEKKELLDEVLDYIDLHLNDKISLKTTAEHFYISEKQLSRLFSFKMEVTFYKYVTQRRLIAAKTYILNNEPIETIYDKVGFSDYSTFYRAFKKAYSLSPQQFKKLHHLC